jgi:hypothetical protein
MCGMWIVQMMSEVMRFRCLDHVRYYLLPLWYGNSVESGFAIMLYW